MSGWEKGLRRNVLITLQEQEERDELIEKREIAALVKRTDLVCPYCEEQPTKANKRTGELLPCKRCYNKRIQLFRYGLTLRDFYRMLREQQRLCAICGEYMKVVHVDHCHDLKHCRGLLCPSCNSGLGQFKDDERLLERAALYLSKNRFKRSWRYNG